jgi:hypothetical protein
MFTASFFRPTEGDMSSKESTLSCKAMLFENQISIRGLLPVNIQDLWHGQDDNVHFPLLSLERMIQKETQTLDLSVSHLSRQFPIQAEANV